MPFTLAHPIAVWPLWQLTQKRLDLPALMVGAMMPDISYFVALHPVSNIGHSLAGIFLEGIPAGLLLLLAGRYLLYRPVLALLPQRVSDRIPPSSFYAFGSGVRLFNIVLSLFAGALSHIAWDSFTHQSGWGVARIGFLSDELYSLPVYKWLQYGGGVVGLCLLFAIALRLFQQATTRYQHSALKQKWIIASYLLIAVVTSLIILQAVISAPTVSTTTELIIRIVVGSVSGLFVGLCLYSSAFWLFSRLSFRQRLIK